MIAKETSRNETTFKSFVFDSKSLNVSFSQILINNLIDPFLIFLLFLQKVDPRKMNKSKHR